MRIAVLGVGGVGGYFGGRLAQAGEDVIFIARGAHLQAMQEHGLRVETDELVLKLISPLRPGLIQSGDDGGFIYLVMPIRLNV
jgi:ketopantoate reductase